MRMMVFDRATCTWRAWNGTRVAWLKLPHAVATAACVASAAVLRGTAPLPALPVERVSSLTAPPPAAGAQVPVTSVLPLPVLDSPVLDTPVLEDTPVLGTPAPGTPLPAAAFLPLPWIFVPTSVAGGSGPWPLSPPGIGGSPSPPAARVVTVTTNMPATQVPEPGSLTLTAWAVLALAAVRSRGRFRRLRKRVPGQ